MKYRVQMNAVFNNADGNSILNHLESIKTDVYKPNFYTPVYIDRLGKKLEVVDNNPTEYVIVDFDAAVASHVTTHAGTEFEVVIDVSFTVQQDLFDLLNYIETIKENASNTEVRSCRYFECKHEELVTPLPKDGDYSYINFDIAPVTHS